MAYVEDAFYDRIANDAAVSAIVGTRIYPKSARKGVSMPLLIYEKVSGVRINDHDGSDLAAPRMSVRIHAKTFRECVDIANKLRVALNGFVGTQSGVPMAIHLLTELDAPFSEADHVYTRIMDFSVYHNE